MVPAILVAGLTPAWQQTLVLDQLRLGEVNRARAVHNCASGKVLNAGIALDRLGAPVKTLTLLGGATGELIRRELGSLNAHWLVSMNATRTCTTLLDQCAKRSTELVENAGSVSQAEQDQFLRVLHAEQCQLLILTGSLPPGASGDFYRRVLEGVRARAILDIRGPELLEALRCRPFLVKPNRDELALTVNRPLVSDADVLAAMRELNERGAECVVVTNGPDPIQVLHEGRHMSLPALSVERVINPIGSGDCLAAGIADALHRGEKVLDAVRWGLACAAENVGQLLPARIDRARVRELFAHAWPRS